jgi:hypothetical protein
MRIGEPNKRNRPQASGRSRDRRDRLHPFGPPSACDWLGDETRVDASQPALAVAPFNSLPRSSSNKTRGD